ncbi:MAG: MFS transporter [Chloroflexi bacterium]|nr:MFS transporter [Chloroflexota bacterium]
MASNRSLPLTAAAKPKLFYGYIVVAASFLAMVVIHGIVNTFGVFFNPLQDYFQASRAAISAASSLSFFVMGFMAILMGILADRFGPRIVLSIGTVIFGAGYLLMSQVSTLWQVYLVFAIIGIGFSPSDVVPLSLVVRWFFKKRGMMSGITKVGTGVGMTVMPVIATVLIDRYEWRTAFLILGILVLVTVIPLAQLLRRDPREIGLLPDGEKRQDLNGQIAAETGLSLRQAIRTRQLWLVCGLYAALLFAAQSVLTHIVPYAVDLGISKPLAASIVATIGGSSIAGRLIMGFSSDKIGRQRGILICFILLVTALSWLQFAKELWMLYLFAAIYGFNHGGFFAQISPLIAWLFGTRSQGSLLGIVIFSGTLFGAISPIITGRLFDVSGTYRWAFLILLLAAIIGLILITMLKPIRQEVKNEPGRSSSVN